MHLYAFKANNTSIITTSPSVHFWRILSACLRPYRLEPAASLEALVTVDSVTQQHSSPASNWKVGDEKDIAFAQGRHPKVMGALWATKGHPRLRDCPKSFANFGWQIPWRIQDNISLAASKHAVQTRGSPLKIFHFMNPLKVSIAYLLMVNYEWLRSRCPWIGFQRRMFSILSVSTSIGAVEAQAAKGFVCLGWGFPKYMGVPHLWMVDSSENPRF